MRLFLSILICIGLVSCYEDFDNSVSVIDIEEQPKTEMGTKLSGDLRDSDEDLLSGYTLIINDESHEVSGEAFLFDLDRVYKYGQLVEAFKQGQLVSLAYPYLLENDINKVELKQLESIERVSFPTDGKVEFDSSLEISIDKDVLSTSSTDLIIESALIPEEHIFSTFGNSAFTADGDLLSLKTSKAFIVNVLDGNTRVDLLDNTSIEFKIEAKDNESLFIYDQDLDYWVEINQLDNNNVRVNQLGYFMVAESQPGVELETTVIDDGRPVSYLRTSLNTNESAQVFTTLRGKLSMVLPTMTDAELEFITLCGDVIGQGSFPTGEDRSINELELDDVNGFVVPINATVVDCDGEANPIQSISVDAANVSSAYFFEDESINTLLGLCDENYSITGLSSDLSEEGTEVAWNNSDQDELGILTSCEDYADGYSYIMIRDDIQVYESLDFSIDNGETLITSDDQKFWIKFQGETTGDYEESSINIVLEDADFGDFGYIIDWHTGTSSGIADFHVSHLETVEKKIRVSFSGKVRMQTMRSNQYGNFDVSGVIVANK